MAILNRDKLCLNGNDLLEINQHLATKLCLQETPKKHPIDEVLKDAPFTGKIEIHSPHCGLQLYVLQLYLPQDVRLQINMQHPMSVVSMVLNGSCTQRVQRPNRREFAVQFNAGKHVICNFQAENSTFDLAGGETHQIVDLHIDPARFDCLDGLSEKYLPKALHPFLLPDQNCREKLETPLYHGLEAIARQIFNCSFQGVSRNLFMAAKAVEILSMEIDVFSQSRASKEGVSTHEFRRLELARQILEKDFDDPPSLRQLSRKVGLNEFKLKRGFRLAYHTTVFGYVRRLRMEKARALLETGDCNVTTAASAVGYSCLAHFAAAFKKHFGFLPSDLLRQSMLR